MLTERKPFTGEEDISIAHAIVHDEPAPVSALRDDVSAKLEDLLLRLLQKDPDKRYATASELLSDLARVDTAAPEAVA
jgi:serine/threonine protein kinase